MKQPDWLYAGPNLNWNTLDKYYQEYLCRKAGHDINVNCGMLNPESKKTKNKVENWIFGQAGYGDNWLWEGKGFVSARYVIEENKNFAISDSCGFSLFIEYVKLVIWKKAVQYKHLDDPYSEKNFIDMFLNGWSSGL